MQSRRGFSLIEVAIAFAILTVALLGVFTAMSSSLTATGRSQPRFIAKQAANRLLNELKADASSNTNFYADYWNGGDGPRNLSPAAVINSGSSAVFIDCDTLGSTFDDILTPAINQQIMRRQGTAPMLRLRFLSESTYNQLWGLSGANLVELNFDTTNGTAVDPTELEGNGLGFGPDYKMFPLQVAVFWRDQGGDHALRMTSVISAVSPLDPDRN